MNLIMKVTLSRANDGKHKFVVTIGDRKVKFGAKGYSDFTVHKDVERKKRYIVRHRARENWSRSGMYTPGFWSRWVLWNKPSLRASFESAKKKVA